MKPKTWTLLGTLFCTCTTLHLSAGHTAWKGGGHSIPSQNGAHKAEAIKLTESEFLSSLSPYHRKKFMNFSQAQKRAAMQYVEKNNLSADLAIEQALRDQIYRR